MKRLPRALTAVAAAVGIALGVAIGTARSDSDVPEAPVAAPAPEPIPAPDPLRGVTRLELRQAIEQAAADLERDRPWAAWRTLYPHVAGEDEVSPGLALLAARAAAGWEAWSHVRSLLRGREWLGEPGHGEGLLLLARAEEEGGNEARAIAAYRRYADAATGPARGVARARMGRLMQGADPAGAAAAYAAAEADLPEVRDWLRALQTEALSAAGDANALVAGALPGGEPAPRARQARAAAAYLASGGDTARAVQRLEEEYRTLAALGASDVAAPLALRRAELLRARGRVPEAREALRRVALDTTAARRDRLRAAQMLGETAGPATVDDELARAAGFEAGREPGRAAKALRAAIAAGAPDDAATRLRLGRLLYEERDWGPARAALQDAAARQADPSAAAEAELLAARALFRSGKKADGLAALRRVAEARAGTPAAGTALYLLADAAGTIDQAIPLYRRAAAVASAPEAREALYRAGDRALRADDPAGAVRSWEEYVARYPTGDQTAEAAYRAGRIHERAGREQKAAAMYRAALAADPLAYYGVRAADRLGVDPLDDVLRAQQPWVGPTTEPGDAAAALRRLDLLEELGMADEWALELASQKRRLERRPVALLTLAEGLRDRGHAVEGIRIGRKLAEHRGGRWDERLLRVVFPFPYRATLVHEAERVGVDPYLLAGLVRQESSFNPRARSWVGATGLAQVMPATGRWLAPGVGIRHFEPELLTVPEISLRMGARYLRDQVRRYDGARDLALAAYNAGPGRADRWRRELGHGGDPDAFREKIPFDETRHYVKVVLRNAAVYRRLYGEDRSPGLVATAYR